VTAGSPPARLLAAVAAGGAIGAVTRWAVTEAFPARGADFPWSTFGINVVGSFALALLPAFLVVRSNRTLTVFLGPGILGGFTTLSAYSEQSRALLADGHVGTAGLYVVGTIAACLLAVRLADRWSTARQRRLFAHEGGDE
jgi:fluoride exporter